MPLAAGLVTAGAALGDGHRQMTKNAGAGQKGQEMKPDASPGDLVRMMRSR